jgi:hypothetical protein
MSNVINRISKSHAARVHTISQPVCFHIALSDVLFIAINQYICLSKITKYEHEVVRFGSIIVVNIKRFNYREHNYVVHNYNAPPTALREVLVEKTTMCVKSGE